MWHSVASSVNQSSPARVLQLTQLQMC